MSKFKTKEHTIFDDRDFRYSAIKKHHLSFMPIGCLRDLYSLSFIFRLKNNSYSLIKKKKNNSINSAFYYFDHKNKTQNHFVTVFWFD